MAHRSPMEVFIEVSRHNCGFISLVFLLRYNEFVISVRRSSYIKIFLLRYGFRYFLIAKNVMTVGFEPTPTN